MGMRAWPLFGLLASVPKRVGPFESPLTARAGPYMDPRPAAHAAGPVWSRLRDVHQDPQTFYVKPVLYQKSGQKSDARVNKDFLISSW